MIAMAPLRKAYSELELYDHIQSSLNIMKIVLDVDIENIEKETVIRILNTIISIKLFIGKRPLCEKPKYEQAILQLFEKSSSNLSSSDILGVMFLLKSNAGDYSIKVDDLYSLLFIDYRV